MLKISIATAVLALKRTVSHSNHVGLLEASAFWRRETAQALVTNGTH
jgi:hypothetical protein